jgi:hypothetical protein
MAGVLSLSQVLSRGTVLVAKLGTAHLSNPKITEHSKYIVILNCVLPADMIYFVMATSKVHRFDKLPHLKAETVPLDPGSYSFLSVPTVLDFTDVQEIAMSQLEAMVNKRTVTVIGKLLAADMDACAEVISTSLHIEPRVLPFVRCEPAQSS